MHRKLSSEELKTQNFLSGHNFDPIYDQLTESEIMREISQQEYQYPLRPISILIST